MTSKIIFENLKIYAYHGVLPEEKILGTYYILNLEISHGLNKEEFDDLSDYYLRGYDPKPKYEKEFETQWLGKGRYRLFKKL